MPGKGRRWDRRLMDGAKSRNDIPGNGHRLYKKKGKGTKSGKPPIPQARKRKAEGTMLLEFVFYRFCPFGDEIGILLRKFTIGCTENELGIPAFNRVIVEIGSIGKTSYEYSIY